LPKLENVVVTLRAVVEVKFLPQRPARSRVLSFEGTTLNDVRTISCFAGFTVSVSLFARTSTEPRSSLLTVGQDETGVVLRVIDPTGVAIPNAHVTVRDEHGGTIVTGNTNQDGLLQLPRLAEHPHIFAVSVSGSPVAEFQSFFSVGPDQSAEIEVAFKDPCYIDDYLNSDEFTAAPFFVDGFQKDSIVVIGPYPILQKPKP
jgi:hypothetical protein